MYVYSDETWHPHETIQAVCSIWWEQMHCEAFTLQVKQLLHTTSIKEMKFARMRRNKEHVDTCIKVIQLLAEYVSQWKLSIRCVIDQYGSLGSIKDMYSHLFKMIENSKISLQHVHFHPDQKNAMKRWRDGQVVEPLMNVLSVHVKERSSIHEPIIQLCDILAGLARDMVVHRWAYMMYLRYADAITWTIRNVDKVIKTRAHIANQFFQHFKDVGVYIDFGYGHLQSTHKNCYFNALSSL